MVIHVEGMPLDRTAKKKKVSEFSRGKKVRWKAKTEIVG
jgi:hypothetical protein